MVRGGLGSNLGKRMEKGDGWTIGGRMVGRERFRFCFIYLFLFF